jgi:hypothetical protein
MRWRNRLRREFPHFACLALKAREFIIRNDFIYLSSREKRFHLKKSEHESGTTNGRSKAIVRCMLSYPVAVNRGKGEKGTHQGLAFGKKNCETEQRIPLLIPFHPSLKVIRFSAYAEEIYMQNRRAGEIWNKQSNKQGDR